MVFKIGNYYKHKKNIFIKIVGVDCRGFIDIEYIDGHNGKLIPEAQGWTEIIEKEWNDNK